MKTLIAVAMLAMGAADLMGANLLEEVRAMDECADKAVGSIGSEAELAAKQAEWRAAFLDGIGGLPKERTALNAKEGEVKAYDGFTLQNVMFESMPGVYVVGHLFLPRGEGRKAPYPVVILAMGHSDKGICYPSYAAHAVMMARAGFAVFAVDPIGQGERRQGAAKFDGAFGECSMEHTRLGARGWLVGWDAARFRIWDLMRAIDWLETRLDLDCTRLGICGTSGGGTMSTYMQALDERVKVAFPNCFVSSIREVFGARGCHDAEQFYWGQLKGGVNHAALLAMGMGRVDLGVGSRWEDYFPHVGAVATFGVVVDLTRRLRLGTRMWHFHCAGPHGLGAATRAAQTDWMKARILREGEVKRVESYWCEDVKVKELAFEEGAAFFTAGHQVRDVEGFRSVYAILAERARELKAAREKRGKRSREELREIVRRRAVIRPLKEILEAPPEGVYEVANDWWYLKGAYGAKRENEAAMMAVVGRSAVGRDAERMIYEAAKVAQTNGIGKVVLRAKGWDVIAAAHAYAAERELFCGVEFEDVPRSWTEMVEREELGEESYAVSVWGALEEYDWTDLVGDEVAASATE